MASIVKRTSKNGKTTYQVKVRQKGAPQLSQTFERLTDARKWAQDTESAIRNGRHFKTSEAKRHTLAELIDRYLETVLVSKPRSAATQQQQLIWWKSAIGTHTLADVTPAILVACRDRLATEILPCRSKSAERAGTARKRSPATVVRYMAALSHAFSVAAIEWQWWEDNPMRYVKKPKEPRGRARFLSDEERERLLAKCRLSHQPDLYLAVVLSISTGARSMEIMSLHWDQVDLVRKTITLYETKNGEIRALPLVGHALELMREREKARCVDTDLVFPGRNSKKPVELRASWSAALTAAKITDFRWHDLRHTCASYLAMDGASQAEIAEVLGHKTLQMVKRYTHLSQAHTSRVVEQMNNKVFR